MSTPRYSIRFDWSYSRRARRWEVVTDGLYGARACAARMISVADSYRASSQRPLGADSPVTRCIARMNRLQMRTSALWARIFAGHIGNDDARLREAEARLDALREELNRLAEALPCLT
jgi:hypothetical protein